jgi:hypothetical protein
MKLKQLYKDEKNILKNDNYYNIPPNKLNVISFRDTETLYSLFKEIMTKSQKGGVDFDFLDLIKHKKRSHSYSIFIIGLRIFKGNNLLKTAVGNKIKEIKNKIEPQFNISFEYIWLMICLYHDLGSSLEQNPCPAFKFSKETLTINHALAIPLAKAFNLDVYKNNWRRYFNYRLSKSVLDHGILGGILFYTELKKQYKELKKDKTEDFFITHNNIGWSKKLLEQVHGYVSWIIISHNMWFINHSEENQKKTEIKEYQDFKLNDLIIYNEQRLFFDQDPFLFLLCLIDSIDPIKKLVTKEHSEDKILDSIDIEIKYNEIIISLSSTLGKRKLKQYVKDIKDLKNWLGVSISESTDSKIIIIKIEDKAARSYKC